MSGYLGFNTVESVCVSPPAALTCCSHSCSQAQRGASARSLPKAPPKEKLLSVLGVAASPLQVKGPQAVTGAAVGHEADGRPGVDGGRRERNQNRISSEQFMSEYSPPTPRGPKKCRLLQEPSRPAVHPGQRCGPEREEFGIDDGEHGLKAAVAVTQGEPQQVQQALRETDRGQQVEV